MVFQVSKTAVTAVLLCASLSASAYARTENFSFYSDEPGKYLAAINAVGQRPESACVDGKANLRAGIVTHHLLAIGLENEFFSCLSRQAKPERIVLIGPDHYGQSMDRIAVSPLPWKTPFGILEPDVSAAAAIKESLGLNNDPEAFSGEHSIGVLVPFIRYYFPESRIVPIIIQRNVDIAKQTKLKKILSHFLDDPKTLVLLSMDFAHNQTSDEADRRDERAMKVIEKLDYRQTNGLDIDCHPGLKILLAALSDRKGIRVQFLNHSNSAKITKQMNLTNVTSYFTILFFKKENADIIHNGDSIQGKN